MRLRAGVVAIALSMMAAPERSGAEDRVVAFVGGRIFDGTGKPAIESGTIVVRNGRIDAVGPGPRVPVPKGAVRVDLAGKTVLPGLVNAHGHVGEVRGLKSGPEFDTEENLRRQLLSYARYGVTTVFSLGGDSAVGFGLRAAQEKAPPGRARLFLAGPVVTAQTAEEARRRVDEVAALKPDIIKIRVDDNLGTAAKMPAAAYEAAIDQAHKRGLRVAAHLYYREDARGLVKAGVDFLAHSIRDAEVDDGLIALMKERDVCLCPTLMREVSTFVYESTPRFFADPFFLREADRGVIQELSEPARQKTVRESRSAQTYKTALETAKRNLKRLADAGVGIAFGTDTGPPARFQGYFEHEELALMVEAGLTPTQALTAATGGAARCLRAAGKVGTLAPGAMADLAVFAANPLEDVRNSHRLESVWIGGERLPMTAP
jgi:imidazolonepropionase-like amidohydrolase